ncbi:protein vav-like [Tropilaelaps mercedesae]|uniref:Protein vav-like n=1 Tax=Tropilaelaps mercedesae TaxID=418985 RepID=A0A1V9XNY2_9ACAR|nr:protein vav-like [Tropilaelaps mercedesae]
MSTVVMTASAASGGGTSPVGAVDTGGDDALWREAVRWLVDLEMLPKDHIVTAPDAGVEHLAYTLRDGVVLCNLALQLQPGCIDHKDMSQRPQKSQFLCNKNIRAFLQALSTHFDIKSPSDLFEPEMLFEYTDFKRVLHTLSTMSNSPPALKSGVVGFMAPKSTGNSDYYNQSMFLNETKTPNGASFDNNGTCSMNGGLTSGPRSPRVIEEEEIYHKICVVPRSAPKPKTVPLEKRDLCIQELLETEKNYIQALQMIRKKFQQPLEAVLTQDDAEVIFKHIRALSEVHRGLLSDLHVANQVPNGRISECFLRWKDSLILYGDYCSNYPRAQQLLQELQSKNDTVAQAIDKCQRETNDGRYQLNTLLCVPIQRVLKYHLLLKELVKNTLPQHDDYLGLEKALEAMLDLSAYINEVKRDSEMLQIIADIQSSITDYPLPRNMQLKDHGRLLKDGEVKVKSHRDQGVKNRYVFVFDRMLLLCKATKSRKSSLALGSHPSTVYSGDQYVYKESISLGSYRVEDYQPLGGTSGGAGGAGSTPASSALVDTLDPPAARQTDHERLEMTTIQAPTYCSQCQKLMKGIFYQGYSCVRCQKILHRDCIAQSRTCQIHSPSLATPLPLSRSAPSIGQARACRSYNGGNNKDHLTFEIGDIIQVTRKLSVVLWEGRIGNRAGFFPAQHVEEISPLHLEEYPWFAGNMSRERAEATLDSCPDGTYLVRISNKQLSGQLSQLGAQPCFAISLKVGGAVKHMRVCSFANEAPVPGAGSPPGAAPNPGEWLYLCKKKLFRSILDLVTWYQENSLAESFAGLNETLRIAYKSVLAGGAPVVISYALVVHDFEPSHTTTGDQNRAQFLPLTKGERVAILSKEGDERGWWKGHLNNNFGFFPKTYVQEIQPHDNNH